MLKLLKQDWAAEQLLQAFNELAIPLQARAESVTVETFAKLAATLTRPSQG
jgi:16S rRNA A1518/A1519 N6-dimethyltransferase RsmA/KsgA/DIM1 with predicted DNA glycosylase/AP lyase activity